MLYANAILGSRTDNPIGTWLIHTNNLQFVYDWDWCGTWPNCTKLRLPDCLELAFKKHFDL